MLGPKHKRPKIIGVSFVIHGVVYLVAVRRMHRKIFLPHAQVRDDDLRNDDECKVGCSQRDSIPRLALRKRDGIVHRPAEPLGDQEKESSFVRGIYTQLHFVLENYTAAKRTTLF